MTQETEKIESLAAENRQLKDTQARLETEIKNLRTTLVVKDEAFMAQLTARDEVIFGLRLELKQTRPIRKSKK